MFGIRLEHFAIIDNFFSVASGMAKALRLSGLQRDVLSLYRKCLREAAKKPEVSI